MSRELQNILGSERIYELGQLCLHGYKSARVQIWNDAYIGGGFPPAEIPFVALHDYSKPATTKDILQSQKETQRETLR